ncbi:paraquat-inducible protein A [Ruegeria sp. 2012CJ41-6]|uniref:Paraquat-inducible protein A n=1 Tax=Ruegeria spongiae TaxID=2942209 RepID=A0ABT0Q1I0_9RHOB|nr:paraquat-inducible protein A [Ruegeria spongiae]MCL6283735.1 paraquat-inducible protein A [Ruegeria spongiae]
MDDLVHHPQGDGMISAREAGLVGCHRCGTVHQPQDHDCRMCGKTLKSRKPNSLQKTWAWLITGLVFYIPANVFPLLSNRVLGSEDGHTIIEGIILFFKKGDFLVASVIMAASLLIPIGKFLIVGFLVLSIHYRWNLSAHARLVLYELVEFIGRWSMIDVFVVALLASLIRLGAIISILPGPGSVCFALSVVFTMISAQSIDAKLIWDDTSKEPKHE